MSGFVNWKQQENMGYISKYNRTFLSFVNRKYSLYKVNFEFIDDYRLWLFYDVCLKNEKLYYKKMEKDLADYSDFQTGRERDKRGKISDNWEKD